MHKGRRQVQLQWRDRVRRRHASQPHECREARGECRDRSLRAGSADLFAKVSRQFLQGEWSVVEREVVSVKRGAASGGVFTCQ